MKYVFLANLAATLFMAGLIWLIQLVHYPLFDKVGAAHFSAYEQAHQRSITPLVGIVMLLELVTALALLAEQPPYLSAWAAWGGAALLGIIWLSTLLLQIPAHSSLSSSFTPEALATLVFTNWLRTVAWSLRSLLLLAAAAQGLAG